MSKTTKTPKTETASEKATALRTPQVRILTALSKSKAPLSRKELAEKAEVDQAGCTEWIGSSDIAKRKANDAKYFPSLLTLGHVKAEEGESGVTYTITASGKKAIAK
jgi:hypothetical protein